MDSIQKVTVVKNFDRRKNPQDVQGLTLYINVEHSIFVEFNSMFGRRLKECEGR